MSQQASIAPSDGHPRRPWGWIFFWALYLAGAASFAGTLLHLRHQYEGVVNRWHAAASQLTGAGERFRDRIIDLEGSSWDQVHKTLGLPLREGAKWYPANPNHRVALVTDPASGFAFELGFFDGQLRGYRVHPKTAPDPDPALLALETVRAWANALAWMLWLGAAGVMVAIYTAPRWQYRLAHVALAVAIAMLIAAQLSLPPGTGLAGRLLDLHGFMSVFVVVPVSVGMLFWLSRRRAPAGGNR